MERINNDYLTAQEHLLFGSSLSEKYTNNPYTPIIVLNGMSVEECNNERCLEGKLKITSGAYWNQKYLDVTMSIEPLNLDKSSSHYGETVSDPALIKLGIPFSKVKDFSSTFPYAREDKPRVKLI